MAQSLASIQLHVVFSSKNRQPLIETDVQKGLWAYMAGTCHDLKCHARRVGGVLDHVHILCQLARTMTVSNLIEHIKTSSSKWMKDNGVPDFFWQNGYGCFSIGQSQVEDVIRYIDGQAEHHRRRTFQEEYLEFLRKYKVDFDERYVWD